MALSYSEYKKKYGNTIANQREINYQKSLTAKDKKKKYQEEEEKRSKLQSEIKNTYTINGVVVGDDLKHSNSAYLASKMKPNYNEPIETNINKNVVVETAKKMDENRQKYDKITATKEVQDQLAEYDAQYQKTAESYYDYLQKKVEEDNIGWYDKTIGRAISGVLSPLSIGRYSLKNENGESYIMPTYSDLKNQKVSQSYETKVGKFLGDATYQLGKMTTSSALNAVVPGAGTVAYFGDIYLDNASNAIAEGYDSKNALAYATISTATEAITQKLLGGASKAIFGGKSSNMSQNISKALTQKILLNNPRLANMIADSLSEGSEEFVQEYIDRFYKNAILGAKNKVFTQETLMDALYSAAIGAFTGGVTGSVDSTNYSQVDQQRQNAINKVVLSPKNETSQEAVINSAVNNQIQQSNLQNGVLPNKIYNSIMDYKVKGEHLQTLPGMKYQYTETDNELVNNLKKSAVANNFSNSQRTINYINMLEKIIRDKGVEIVFDSTLPPEVNGKYKNGVITINPNSPRSGEFIAIHELTHAIGTDAMRSIINKYRKSNSEFDNAVQRLLNNYKLNELNEEAMADIAGQLLGNQDFIYNLSKTNPNLFVKIYNEIRYLWHQLVGYKNQNQFIEDLQYKWEQAYRSNKELNGTTNYFIENIASFDQNEYNTIKEERLNVKEYANLSNLINSDLTIKPGRNIIENVYDYTTEKYKDYEIYYKSKGEFKVVKSKNSGVEDGTRYSKTNDNGIKTTRSRQNSSELGNGMAQDRISSEKNDGLFNFDQRKTYTKGKDNRNYRQDSRGELDDSSFSLEQQLENQASKIMQNTQDMITYFEQYLDEEGIINPTDEDIRNSLDSYDVYDASDKFDNEAEEKYFNAIKEYLTEKSKTVDNQGRKLTKKQQNFFKDSKARDENGKLVTVYHTTTEEGYQFNEFNPVGTEYYRFGDQVVNYYTDDKDMSGSYANQDYVMADTKKLTSMKQVNDYIKKMNSQGWGSNRTYELIEDNGKYKLINNSKIENIDKTWQQVYDEANEYKKSLTEEEMAQFKDMFDNEERSGRAYNIDSYLRKRGYEFGSKQDEIAHKYLAIDNKNATESGIYFDVLMRDAKYRAIGSFDTLEDLYRNLKTEGQNLAKRQYEGYVNITNPYVIDAEGRNWNRIESKKDSSTTEKMIYLDSLTKDRLIQLATDSKNRYEKNYSEYRKWLDATNSIDGNLREENNLQIRSANRVFREVYADGVKAFINNEYKSPMENGNDSSLNSLYEWRTNNDIMIKMSDWDLITQAEYEEFNKTLQVPEHIRKTLKDLANTTVKYNEYDSEGRNPVVKEGTLLEIWDNYQSASKTYFNEGRYDYSIFDDQLLSGYLNEELKSSFPIRDEFGVNEDSLKDLFKVASHNFDENYIRSQYNEWSVTNDIVKKILELNKFGEKYDGVIIKNTLDYGGRSETKDPHDLYVTFNSNQFKAVDNTQPTKDADIRYSKKNQSWQEYLEKNFPSTGTVTHFEEIRLPGKEIEIPKNPTKESSYDDIDLDEAAKILNAKPQTESKKENRLKTLFATQFVDKGYYIDKIARHYNNRELSAKYDYSLLHNGIANQIIGKGRYDKNGNKIGKSLYEIFEPIERAGLVKQFSEYVYHIHNIDRMNLTTTHGEDNKPVFGSLITAETSQNKVKELLDKYPEFESWAEEIYKYNRANLQMLVDNGVITSDDMKYYNNKYPHYVPVVRENSINSNQGIKFIGNKASVGVPIKKAKGGNSNLLPLKDAMSIRTMQTTNSALKNDFGIELINTIYSDEAIKEMQNATNAEDIIDNMESNEVLIKGDKQNDSSFTIYLNGQKITIPISNEIYTALTPRNLVTIKWLNKLNNIRRALLTEYSPAFLITNPVKDLQDGTINSKHPLLYVKKLPEAVSQITNKGKLYQLYMANGGGQDTYFNYDKGTEYDSGNKYVKTGNKIIDTIKLPLKVLDKVSSLNQSIEMAPRLAEFIASLEAGDSIQTAMYNAQEITTNFKRGGDIAKTLDRNGFTFLNAGIQGAAKQVRNIQDAKVNGIRGIASLAVKFSIAGLGANLLNDLIWGDDEEYEELSDYIKNSYYIIGKYGDSNFIRIPKGRVTSVIQKFFEEGIDLAKGEKVDVDDLMSLMANQVLPNDPTENNLLSPLIQAFGSENGIAWYGGDLVPQRLQNLPNEEQYDESTDKLSIWLGQKLGISPYKLNYVLDQYSGFIGDFTLPYLTAEAESSSNNILAPLKDKFTTNSIMKNQNITDFYELKDKMQKNNNSSKATDEDKLQYKYLNSINSQMSDLYAEKRAIQVSNISNKEKYKRVQEIQSQINDLAKNALSDYKKVKLTDNYATVNDIHYYKNTDNEWTKIKSTDKGLNLAIDAKINMNEYIKYKNTEFKADKDKNGKTITDSRKKKIINYVNALKLSIPEKAIIIKMEYSSYDKYDKEIINYINRLSISQSDKTEILEYLGFTIKNGKVYR